jgi:putative nucleotidyltransferase with HDIG domain
MNNSIKHITIDELEVGMFITDMHNDWVPDKNMSRRGMINRPEVIEQIRSLGVTDLYIDTTKGKTASEPNNNQPKSVNLMAIKSSPNLLPKPKVSFAKEIENAKSIQSEAVELIDRCMTEAKLGHAIDLMPVSEMANGMIESLSQNHNALACITQLKMKDRYLMEHSFNVSVLMGILGTAIGYESDKLHQMVTGALLHDIGKIKVNDEVLHKPGKLNPTEWAEMKKHVTYGEEVLLKTPNITPIMIDICAQHHERLDGNGYPRGLAGDEIPVHSRMASVVDVYDAITAERVYHKGMAPTVALKKMLEWSTTEGHLDPQIVYRFIQAMGVYPVGSVVELNNQKLAVVIDSNPDDPTKPKVMEMYNLRTHRYDNKLKVDLADERCNRKIIKAVYAETYGINPGDFI